MGVVNFEEALKKAEEAGLDLVEVAPNEVPPVCKIEDYGKVLYKQKKIEKKNKKQKVSELKSIRLSIAISEHDTSVKVKQAEKFLKLQHPVKVALMLKGREISYRDLAVEKLNSFYESLKEIAQLEQAPKAQGSNIFMILSPKKN